MSLQQCRIGKIKGCYEGGNDYDIYLDIEENRDGEAFRVKSPQDTLKILEALNE